MSNYEFDLPIPKQHKELLLSLVDKAKKYNVLSARFFSHTSNDVSYIVDFVFSDEEKGHIEINFPENPLPSFEVLGFIHYEEKQRTVIFTPQLFKWAKYEKKNTIGKFWMRLPEAIKDLMLAIAFILSLALTIIEILQNLKIIPTP
jgi:hypothetical protein